MSTRKSFVLVNILGVTKTPQLSKVRINRPLTDISTMKRSKGAFRISDYIAVDEFEYLHSNAIEYTLEIKETISHKQPTAYVYLTTDNLLMNVGEKWWIKGEQVGIMEITQLDADYYRLKISKALSRTIPVDMISERDVERLLNDARYNSFDFEYNITNFKREFRGLIVELTSQNGDLLAVGVIKTVSYSSGAMVIDCEDLAESINGTISKFPLWLSARVVEPNPTTSYIDAFAYGIGCPLLLVPENGLGFQDENYPYIRMTTSPLWDYLNIDSYREMVRGMNQTAANIKPLSAEDLLALKEELDYPSVTDIKVKTAYDFIQFFSGYVIVFDWITGEYVCKNLTSVRSDFERATLDTKERLMGALSNPKYAASQYEVTREVSLSWNDTTTHISLADYAGIGSSKTLEFSLNTTFDEDMEIAFRENIIDNYLNAQYLTVAELKVEMPEKLIEQKFNIGKRFEILDIADFMTFQKRGKEVFIYGVVSTRTGNELTILVTAGIWYNPIAPQLDLSNPTYISNAGNIWRIRYDVNNIDELTGLTDDFSEASPFTEGALDKYFDVDYNVLLFGVNSAGSTRGQAVVKGIGTNTIDFDMDITILAPNDIDGCIYSAIDNAYQRRFFKIQESRWI